LSNFVRCVKENPLLPHSYILHSLESSIDFGRSIQTIYYYLRTKWLILFIIIIFVLVFICLVYYLGLVDSILYHILPTGYPDSGSEAGDTLDPEKDPTYRAY